VSAPEADAAGAALRDLYSGAMAEAWQRLTAANIDGEVALVERALEPRWGARLLDVPCGDGRHAVPLARIGHRMCGVDMTPRMLERAREHARAAGVTVDWRLADMTELPAMDPFDGALCLGNSFPDLDREQAPRFLGSLAGALRPGGRFLLHTNAVEESLEGRPATPVRVALDDITLEVQRRELPGERCLEFRYTLHTPAGTETHVSPMWLAGLDELGAMLDDAGLRVLERWRDTARRPYETGAPDLFLLAERTAP
jgi:SAM-dependent methyltransferase